MLHQVNVLGAGVQALQMLKLSLGFFVHLDEVVHSSCLAVCHAHLRVVEMTSQSTGIRMLKLADTIAIVKALNILGVQLVQL